MIWVVNITWRPGWGHRELAHDWGVPDVIDFAGELRGGGWDALLRSGDISISLAVLDETSWLVLEVMHVRLSPAGTDIAANREWITRRINGLIFEPGSPDT